MGYSISAGTMFLVKGTFTNERYPNPPPPSHTFCSPNNWPLSTLMSAHIMVNNASSLCSLDMFIKFVDNNQNKSVGVLSEYFPSAHVLIMAMHLACR